MNFHFDFYTLFFKQKTTYEFSSFRQNYSAAAAIQLVDSIFWKIQQFQ